MIQGANDVQLTPNEFTLSVQIRSFRTEKVMAKSNKQIQRIYVPRQEFFREIRNQSEISKIIGEVTLIMYLLSTYVDSNTA